MLAKMTAKNQITLPKAAVQELGEPVEYFEVRTEQGSIILTPVRISRADGVRSRLAAMGLSEQDVEAARAWARKAR
jgi:bifunctional DNA-binding transcriptional regulator/antitoxin component of YhaV-PrlF toxin-antitoxin module